MLPWVCSVIDHRRRQNVVRTSVTHSAIASCATFLFLPHFDVICDLLLNRRTATWNLFVIYTINCIARTAEPSKSFLHSSFLFFPFETTGCTQECSRLDKIVILRKEFLKEKSLIIENYSSVQFSWSWPCEDHDNHFRWPPILAEFKSPLHFVILSLLVLPFLPFAPIPLLLPFS